jgi:xylulokinase
VNHVIGLDVSTTATKAVLIDRSGTVQAVRAFSYDFETPRPLWAEQDPRLWWGATLGVMSQLMGDGIVAPGDIAAIGLTGQMHGSVLLDESGEVIRPAILWNDQRTESECQEIRRRVGLDRLIQISGNDALTGFTAPKLLWVARNEPDNWARVRHVLLPKDYVRYRLTNDYAVDVAGGSGTILFDLAKRTWSAELLSALEIDPALLPPTFEGPAVTGTVCAEAADATGLRPGTPVVAGGGDQAASAVGIGAVASGVVALSLGTSGVVFATTDGPMIEASGRLHSFCHAVPGRWHMMGVMLSAGGSLRWLRDALAPGRSFDDLVSGAAEIPVGSEGLLFLPHLTGERTPHPDPLARGAFVGLTIRHDLRHLTRAVLEGVAFSLRDGLDLMTNTGMEKPAQIRASGGGTKSQLWRQILADVLQTEIATVEATEGAAYGAGLLAAVGAGWFDDVETACSDFVSVRPSVAMSDATVPMYEEAFGRYRSLYPALTPIFHATPVT